jgi:hypothetical protein
MPQLDHISWFSSLLPILAFIPLLFKKNEMPIWVIFLYSVYSFTNDAIIIYRSDHEMKFSIFLYTFTVIEYLLFSYILLNLIQSKLIRKIIVACSVLFVVFCLFNMIDKPVSKFDSLQASIESILVLIYCVIYFFEQINQPKVIFLYSTYTFWIVVAILIYLAGTFFLYVFAANIPDAMRYEYWPINLICNILKNILFAVAIIMQAKNPTPKDPYLPRHQPFLN